MQHWHFKFPQWTHPYIVPVTLTYRMLEAVWQNLQISSQEIHQESVTSVYIKDTRRVIVDTYNLLISLQNAT